MEIAKYYQNFLLHPLSTFPTFPAGLPAPYSGVIKIDAARFILVDPV